MAQLIEMPKLSDTMEEGCIAAWCKKEGEYIEEGTILAEIETDKATIEYSSPVEGFLLKILLPVGQHVPLGQAMAVFGERKDEGFDLQKLLSQRASQESSLADEKNEIKDNSPSLKSDVQTSSELTSQTQSKRIKASPLAEQLIC